MAQVTLRINGYGYTIGCQDGEEEHLLAMAAEVERRLDSVKAVAGPSGEARMLLMAALLLADDLHETRAALEGARAAPPPPRDEARARRRIARLAETAEALADRLDPPGG
ncbi:MAG: cell division protein ZapA [Acetobacteraceae bacterium]